MPSFDIVSELDMQEVDNAFNQAQKEIETRFDFRGGKSKIDFDRQKDQHPRRRRNEVASDSSDPRAKDGASQHRHPIHRI